jgi:trimethylamine:corrinoid methyltransferase-like protein
MALQGHRCASPYRLLTAHEVTRIVEGSLVVLAETGMKVDHAGAPRHSQQGRLQRRGRSRGHGRSVVRVATLTPLRTP